MDKKVYRFLIEETYFKNVFVLASDSDSAYSIVNKKYAEGDIELGDNDFAGSEIDFRGSVDLEKWGYPVDVIDEDEEPNE